MSSFQIQGMDSLYRFWLWWWGEIRQLIPARIAAFFSSEETRLVLKMERGVTRLQLLREDSEHLLAVCNLEKDGHDKLAEIRESFLSDLPGTVHLENVHVELQVPRERILTHEVYLPQATEPNLASVLEFEIDRFTPFRADQVCYSWEVTGRLPEQEKIKVALQVIRRDYLDDLLAKLSILGLTVSRVVPAESNPPGPFNPVKHNLLPLDLRPEAESLWNTHNRNLAVTAAALLIAVLVLPIYLNERRVSHLESEIAAIQKQAQAVSTKQAKLASQVGAQDALILRKNNEPGKLPLIHQVTRLLPDNTWVSRLEIGDSGVSLQGESRKASDLIEILDRSPAFENVKFASSITRNPTTNMERFEIRMDLTEVPAGE